MVNYSGMQRGELRGANTPIIDLRSDTVTQPSEPMYQAMTSAPVGDDVYGDDPTVNKLEEMAADLFGKQAALFTSSGSQSNLCALLAHCGRGEEYIAGANYHISHDEAGGAAVLGGISPCHLRVNSRGGLTPDQVEAVIRPDDIHYAISRLVCLENTVNGVVQDQDNINVIAELAHGQSLKTHMDGARIMNAVVASGASAADLTAKMDSVSLCLSKGLGAPVGSLLCGDQNFIQRARRYRKMLGGGTRQAGVLAACGLYALENNVVRLADDHARAKRLSDALAAIPALEIQNGEHQTNMVFIKVPSDSAKQLQGFFANRNITIAEPEPVLRIVIHMNIDDESIDAVINAFGEFYGD